MHELLSFTPTAANPKLYVITVIQLSQRLSKPAMVFCAGLLLAGFGTFAQAPSGNFQPSPAERQTEKPREKTVEPPNAAQIELLETKYRFETNGDSRKEVHALVRINSELGVRQFARLNFDYNRSFQSVEIPLAHITHASGGTADILPGAITDAPNPAVEKFPAYHDVRVKSVRILGLQPGDSLEYRVVTTTTHHPLAPDFWLEHSFDRTGVVQVEDFTLDLPANVTVHLGSEAHADSVEKTGADGTARSNYHWRRTLKPGSNTSAEQQEVNPDIAFTTLDDIGELADRLAQQLYPRETPDQPIQARAQQFLAEGKDPEARIRAIYDFVSQKITTVDLPLGTTGFRRRNSTEILNSGYGTPEDKATLFASLSRAVAVEPYFYFVPSANDVVSPLLPSEFEHLLVGTILTPGKVTALDLSLEVAPFGVVSAKLRGKTAFCATEIGRPHAVAVDLLPKIPDTLPFAASQLVRTASTISSNGTLATKVTYSLRGDNELLLRVAFHRTPSEKQSEIAQYLALSDGFRGKVTSVKTSDPYDTEKPFKVEYEITQEKFVDWSKKPVRIPALLPLPGLPEAPKKLSAGAKIELGPPLEVDLSGALKLPAGTTAQAPVGTSVKRDYASFVSQYSAAQNVLHFSRHLNFIASELPAERSLDLNAFLHAVQNDQALLFELDKPASVPPAGPK